MNGPHTDATGTEHVLLFSGRPRPYGAFRDWVYGDLIPLDRGGRIAWVGMTHPEICKVIELADRYGEVSVLRGARAALKRREADTRPRGAA